MISNKKEIEFIKSLLLPIDDMYEPLIVYTHCYHETGGFKSFAGENNCAGIKVPMMYLKTHKPPFFGWDGISKDVITHEIIKGKKIKIIDRFCSFSSIKNFMTFYLFTIKRVYPSAYDCRSNYALYFNELQKGGFATDKDYAKKLKTLYAHILVNDKPKDIYDILRAIK